MKDSWCILTNPMDERLAAMSAEFFPKGVPVVSFNGRDGLYGYEFLMKALPSKEIEPYSYCIYIDTDCFIIDWDALEDWIYMCRHFGAVVGGMPDGGVISHRMSDVGMPNLFLTYFDLDRIRSVWNEKAIRERNYTYRNPPSIIPINQNIKESPRCEVVRAQGYVPYSSYAGCIEPYYNIFDFLFEVTGTHNMSLYAEDAPDVDGDGACTRVFGPRGIQPMALHTWFAREYGKDDYHTNRINRVYMYAKGYKVYGHTESFCR